MILRPNVAWPHKAVGYDNVTFPKEGKYKDVRNITRSVMKPLLVLLFFFFFFVEELGDHFFHFRFVVAVAVNFGDELAVFVFGDDSVAF
jgi:hypothetical protein